MAKQNRTAAAEASDQTADRLRAYVASVRPRRGCHYSGEIDERMRRAPALIERLALSAPADDLPTVQLSPTECADILCFVSNVEPISERNWWRDPPDATSHVAGFSILMYALETSLRARPTMRRRDAE